MIKKDRKIPLTLLKLEALLRRLPKSHPKRTIIEIDLRKSFAGYRGEQSIDYHLSLLDQKKYLILHDLRIPWGKEKYFQLDTVILTKRFILIIEVKNIAGTLFFDQQFNQLIRTLDEKEEAFPDPILQNNRHVLHIKAWLKQQNISVVPIIPLVVISKSSSIIKSNPSDKGIFLKVVRSEKLPHRINDLYKDYPSEILQNKDLNKISRLLIKQHTPLDVDVLKKYGIDKSEILNGVHCSVCVSLSMTRVRGNWICVNCKSTNKKAHVSALFDYFLIVEKFINNIQFRKFINIGSESVARKLLQSMQFQHTGTYKDHNYILTLESLEKFL